MRRKFGEITRHEIKTVIRAKTFRAWHNQAYQNSQGDLAREKLVDENESRTCEDSEEMLENVTKRQLSCNAQRLNSRKHFLDLNCDKMYTSEQGEREREDKHVQNVTQNVD